MMALLVTVALTLTACSIDGKDDVYMDVAPQNEARGIIYDGEWTVDRQLVDMAQMEVSYSLLTLKLPEAYLAGLCFGEASDPMACAGQPIRIPFAEQGYSDNAAFYSFTMGTMNYLGETMSCTGYFSVKIGNVDYDVDLFSNENGSVVHRIDTGHWTVAVPITHFLVMNQITQEQKVHKLSSAVTLYYNTKGVVR